MACFASFLIVARRTQTLKIFKRIKKRRITFVIADMVSNICGVPIADFTNRIACKYTCAQVTPIFTIVELAPRLVVPPAVAGFVIRKFCGIKSHKR